MYLLLTFIARALSKFSRLLLKFARRFEPSGIQRRNVISSTRYDMVLAEDEPYYAEQYWNIIVPHLNGFSSDANALDLGCSQGRFSIKLGQCFGQGSVVGCDLSADAISRAFGYAARHSVENVDFRVQPIADCVSGFSEKSIDVVMMTEVTFFYPNWKQDLPGIMNVIKPGGLLVISFRSQYFDALCLVRGQLWEGIDQVLQDRQGTIFGSSTVFTWQTSEEIRSLLVDDCGLELLELRGIGVCSGIPGDPHDVISRPSQLSDDEKLQLMKLELELGKTVPDAGRYILAVARVS